MAIVENEKSDLKNIHVAWDDNTDGVWGTDTEIMYANFTTAAGWSNATVISDGYGGSFWNDDGSYQPSITADGTGNIHIIWADDTDGGWGNDAEIMYTNYSSATGWSNATVISDGFGGSYWNDGSSSKPSITSDGAGGIHAVWRDYTEGIWGTDAEIMYANYTSAEGWSNASIISDGYEGSYWNTRSGTTNSMLGNSNV